MLGVEVVGMEGRTVHWMGFGVRYLGSPPSSVTCLLGNFEMVT